MVSICICSSIGPVNNWVGAAQGQLGHHQHAFIVGVLLVSGYCHILGLVGGDDYLALSNLRIFPIIYSNKASRFIDSLHMTNTYYLVLSEGIRVAHTSLKYRPPRIIGAHRQPRRSHWNWGLSPLAPEINPTIMSPRAGERHRCKNALTMPT